MCINTGDESLRQSIRFMYSPRMNRSTTLRDRQCLFVNKKNIVIKFNGNSLNITDDVTNNFILLFIFLPQRQLFILESKYLQNIYHLFIYCKFYLSM